MVPSVLSGGCCCGAVRYESRGAPFHQTICHCPTCRRSCGAPSVGWASVASAAFHITVGEPASHASSPGVTRQFCARCGTQLSYQRADSPEEIDITIGSLDAPEHMPPLDHTFTEYRLPWEQIADGLPQYRRLRGEVQKE